MFPVEGVVLDFSKLNKSRLPSRHSKGAWCDKSFQHWLGSRHQSGVAHRGSVSIRKPRGVDVTLTDVFKSTAPQKRSATVTVADGGGMIPFKAEMLAFKSSQSELLRLANARARSKINSMSRAFGDDVQQAESAWLQLVTLAGATVEVLCHADL